MSAPIPSTIAPTQSPRVHVARHARARSDHQTRSSADRAKTPITSASCVLTNGATSDAATAPAIQPRERWTSAFAISRKQSVAHGYASGSSSRNEENASDGIAAVAAAANSDAGGRTSIRARKYAGNIADV